MSCSRSDRHWSILVTEYKTCVRKLRSKKEGHKILVSLLAQSNNERDELQNNLDTLKAAGVEFCGKGGPSLEKMGIAKDVPTTVQGLLLHIKDLKRDAQLKDLELDGSKERCSELIKDLKALRADKSGSSRVSPGPSFPREEREERDNFLAIIQSLQQEVETSGEKLKVLNDETSDLRLEREFYKQKLNSATEQLLEKNDCQPIADIELLLDENRQLREKVEKLQHINTALVEYKTERSDRSPNPVSVHTRRTAMPQGVLKKDKKASQTRKLLFNNKPRNTSKHVTFDGHSGMFKPQYEEGEEEGGSTPLIERIKEKIRSETELKQLQGMIGDMQRVSNGLAETVLDKNTALKHQRDSNRLLGDRVCELEAKLRTLEMSGFWSVPDSMTEGGIKEDVKRKQLERLTLNSSTSSSPTPTVGEGGEALFDFEEITSADIFGDDDEESVVGETILDETEASLLGETEASLLGETDSLLGESERKREDSSSALLSGEAEGKAELWFEAQCQEIEEQDI